MYSRARVTPRVSNHTWAMDAIDRLCQDAGKDVPAHGVSHCMVELALGHVAELDEAAWAEALEPQDLMWPGEATTVEQPKAAGATASGGHCWHGAYEETAA